MANMRTVKKTVQYGADGYWPDAPVEGARPVMFLNEDDPDNPYWENKGWLMPEVRMTAYGLYTYKYGG